MAKAAEAQHSTLPMLDLGLVAPTPTSLDESVFTGVTDSFTENRQANYPGFPQHRFHREKALQSYLEDRIQSTIYEIHYFKSLKIKNLSVPT